MCMCVENMYTQTYKKCTHMHINVLRFAPRSRRQASSHLRRTTCLIAVAALRSRDSWWSHSRRLGVRHRQRATPSEVYQVDYAAGVEQRSSTDIHRTDKIVDDATLDRWIWCKKDELHSLRSFEGYNLIMFTSTCIRCITPSGHDGAILFRFFPWRTLYVYTSDITSSSQQDWWADWKVYFSWDTHIHYIQAMPRSDDAYHSTLVCSLILIHTPHIDIHTRTQDPIHSSTHIHTCTPGRRKQIITKKSSDTYIHINLYISDTYTCICTVLAALI